MDFTTQMQQVRNWLPAYDRLSLEGQKTVGGGGKAAMAAFAIALATGVVGWIVGAPRLSGILYSATMVTAGIYVGTKSKDPVMGAAMFAAGLITGGTMLVREMSVWVTNSTRPADLMPGSGVSPGGALPMPMPRSPHEVFPGHGA